MRLKSFMFLPIFLWINIHCFHRMRYCKCPRRRSCFGFLSFYFFLLSFHPSISYTCSPTPLPNILCLLFLSSTFLVFLFHYFIFYIFLYFILSISFIFYSYSSSFSFNVFKKGKLPIGENIPLITWRIN